MKKYFITSDTHSYFTILQKTLKRKGFDINNPDHIFVLLGDLFDRGEESLEIYNWVKSLPRERRILIRGNHEALLRELVKRGYAESHDYHNGTYDTLFQLAHLGFKNETDMTHEYYRELARKQLSYGDPGYEDVRLKYKNLRNKLYRGKVKEVVDWIDSDEWVNYWETPNYIFTHGFIPLREYIDWEKSNICGYIIKTQETTFREDWRNATSTEWEDASWFNWRTNYQLVKDGINKTGKYIVVGHWYTSDLYKFLNGTKKSTYDCPIYKSKRYRIIGLDACTAGSYRMNMLVLNEDEL